MDPNKFASFLVPQVSGRIVHLAGTVLDGNRLDGSVRHIMKLLALDARTHGVLCGLSVYRESPFYLMCFEVKPDFINLIWLENGRELKLEVSRAIIAPTVLRGLSAGMKEGETLNLSTTTLATIVDNGTGTPLNPSGGTVQMHLSHANAGEDATS